jgi:hypothetical protein
MLTTFDLKTRVSFPQATTKAAAENGFYLLESPEGETSTAAEEALSFAESEAARAFAKVLADDRHRLSVDERIAVAGFVALQAVRTDHVRAQLDELAAGLAKGMPAAFTSATLGSSRSAHIGVMFEVLRPAIERLAVLEFGVLTFERRSLATSDHPVLLVRQPTCPEDAERGTGILNADEIWLAISNRRALVLAERVNAFATTKLANWLNYHVADRARRWVYWHPDDDPYRGREIPAWKERVLDLAALDRLADPDWTWPADQPEF